MSGFDYSKTAATVARLLERFGAPAVVSRKSAGVRDPDTGATSAGTLQTWDVSAVKLDYKAGEIDGTLVQAGDQKLYMNAVAGLEPKAGDLVDFGGSWRVMASKTLAPAGVAVLLEVQVRKA